MKLDFSLKEDSDSSIRDWRSVNEALLRYDCFLGDIVFVVGGADLSTNWGWVPMLDFAISMRFVVDDLEESESAMFDFTDSDHTIEFAMVSRTLLQVRSSYASSVGTVPLGEFKIAASRFLGATRAFLENSFQGLIENPHYKETLGKYW